MKRPLALLASLLLVTACGQDPEITVRVEEAPSLPGATPPPPPGASPPGAPSPTVPAAQPPPPPPAAAPPVAVAASTVSTAAAPATSSARVPHAVALFYDGPFFPSVAASLAPLDLPTGTPSIHDILSQDGFGAAGRLGTLVPGRYQLRLSASAAAVTTPLLDLEIFADGRRGTSVTVGWVRFRIPGKHADRVGRGIALDLLQLPDGVKVFSGPLASAAVVDSSGKRHEASLLLPLASYSFALRDLDEKDDVAIAASGGRPGLVESDQNRFDLSATRRSTIVDLQKALVLR